VLIVDPDSVISSAYSEIASGMGHDVSEVQDVESARKWIAVHPIDVMILNIPYGGAPAIGFAKELKSSNPEIDLIALASTTTVSFAVEAMRFGALDYLLKPFGVDEFVQVLDRMVSRRIDRKEIRNIRRHLETTCDDGCLLTRSGCMQNLVRMLPKVANSSFPALILGESGTGKELLAKKIHETGPRAQNQFLAVDCGALTPTLIESELFGHEKGAYTGASASKKGLLASACGGTVFLDEIAELPLELQTRLLRVLQEKEVRPIGSTRAIPVDARILAATNRDISAMVSHGTFRKDLYYRLNVVCLKIPPLRDRKDDIPFLIAHFLEQNSRNRGQRSRFSLSDGCLRAMMLHDWPGNIRELENAVNRACTLTDGSEISLGDLPTSIKAIELSAAFQRQKEYSSKHPESLGDRSLAAVERKAIIETLEAVNGDRVKAAKLLGIGKTTLYRKLKEYGDSYPKS